MLCIVILVLNQREQILYFSFEIYIYFKNIFELYILSGLFLQNKFGIEITQALTLIITDIYWIGR